MLLPIDMYNEFGEMKVNELAHDVTYEKVKFGLLKIGAVYKILVCDGGTDFVSVGASANIVGLRFVCNKATLNWVTGDELQRGYTNEEVVQNNITASTNTIKSVAIQQKKEFQESNTLIRLAILKWTMYILYLENRQESAGDAVRKEALDLLARMWGSGVYNFTKATGTNSYFVDATNAPLRQPMCIVVKPDYEAFDAEEGNYGIT